MFWAVPAVEGAALGDARWALRLVHLLDGLREHPTASILQASGTGAQTQGVTLDAMLAPHCQQTMRRVAESPVLWAVQDPTVFHVTLPRHTRGLDPLGQAGLAGFFLPAGLAVSPHAVPLGLLGGTTGVRPPSPHRKTPSARIDRGPSWTRKVAGGWRGWTRPRPTCRRPGHPGRGPGSSPLQCVWPRDRNWVSRAGPSYLGPAGGGAGGALVGPAGRPTGSRHGGHLGAPARRGSPADGRRGAAAGPGDAPAPAAPARGAAAASTVPALWVHEPVWALGLVSLGLGIFAQPVLSLLSKTEVPSASPAELARFTVPAQPLILAALLLFGVTFFALVSRAWDAQTSPRCSCGWIPDASMQLTSDSFIKAIRRPTVLQDVDFRH